MLTSMNQTLLIPEIRRIIVAYCDSSSLACLARTWSKFTDLALNELYRHLNEFNMYQIFKTLPRDSWIPWDTGAAGGLRVRHVRGLPLTFTRAIRPSEWERFQYYSRRVKSVRVSVDESLLSAISTLLGSSCSPLFPNLTALEFQLWDIARAGFMEFWAWINIFSCKGLKKLSFSFPHDMAEQERETFFYRLPTLFPTLERINISRDYNAVMRNGEGLIYALKHLPTLSQLSLSSEEYSPSVWETIIRLPSLRELDIIAGSNFLGLVFEEIFPILEKLNINMGFSVPSTTYLGLGVFASSSLTDLTARATSSFCLCLVKACGSCPLRSLQIEADVDAVTDESTFLANLSDEISIFSNLEALDFITHHYEEPAPKDFEPLTSSFLSLQRLHKLRTLALVTHRPLRLWDEDVRTIVASWPALEEFRVETMEDWYPEVGMPEESRLSLQSLVIFAELPNLKKLNVPVKGPFVGLRTDGIVNKALTQLSVGSSAVSSSLQVAIFLHSLFPCLQSVGGPIPVDNFSDSSSSWSQVTENLKAIPLIKELVREEKQCDCTS